MPGFEPQTDVHFLIVSIDHILQQTPNAASNEATLLVCPLGVNFQLELLGVSYPAVILPADGTNNVNIDLEFVDDSDSDAVTALVSAFTLDDNRTARVANEVFRGHQILDPGDTIAAQFDVTTPDTAAQGAVLQVEYRVLRRS